MPPLAGSRQRRRNGPRNGLLNCIMPSCITQSVRARRNRSRSRAAHFTTLLAAARFLDPEADARLAQSPGFCLASLAAILLLIALASGFLPLTRLALLPLAVPGRGRIVTIAQAGTIDHADRRAGRGRRVYGAIRARLSMASRLIDGTGAKNGQP